MRMKMMISHPPSCSRRPPTARSGWVMKGEDEDYDPTGYKRSDMIRFLRNPLYMQDSEGAQEVRGRILGLDPGLKPTKHQVNPTSLNIRSTVAIVASGFILAEAFGTNPQGIRSPSREEMALGSDPVRGRTTGVSSYWFLASGRRVKILGP